MLKVYLAGEIHTNWREEIIENCKKENLDIQFSSPVTDHESSDNCGIDILGEEEKNFWKDRKGANINSIRTKIQDMEQSAYDDLNNIAQKILIDTSFPKHFCTAVEE